MATSSFTDQVYPSPLHQCPFCCCRLCTDGDFYLHFDKVKGFFALCHTPDCDWIISLPGVTGKSPEEQYQSARITMQKMAKDGKLNSLYLEKIARVNHLAASGHLPDHLLSSATI